MKRIWHYYGPGRLAPTKNTVEVIAANRHTAKIRYVRRDGRVITRYTKLQRLV